MTRVVCLVRAVLSDRAGGKLSSALSLMRPDDVVAETSVVSQ